MSTVQAPAAGRAAPEQTRARYPDDEGYLERDGVRVFWERYGDGETTVFLLPTWSIVHARLWKAQVPYLARHYRVLTSDPRGNGRSDRPAGAAAYTERELAADALAVMDATATEQAVLVSLSCGALWSTLLAADHPDRAAGLVYIGPAVGLAPPHPERAVHSFLEPLDTDEGWAKYNQHYWLRDYRGFLEYFFSRCLTEPHSTKQHEDCVGWALEMSPETLIDTEQGLLLCSLESFERQCRRVRCPVLVIHGDEDAIRPHAQGAALAAATRGRLVTLAGAGHLPQARDPVKVNLLLREFVESLPAGEAVVTLTTTAPEQSRAASPDMEGYVERDGVRVFWERYGSGDPTLLLLPAWSIIHSRQWKAQLPYLARHYRVVTFDGRGNGHSDRPSVAEAYDDAEFVADALAVLDATGTGRAVLVGLSRGGRWAVELAAARPERVLGAVLIDPGIGFVAPPHPWWTHPFEEPLDTDEGWAKFNRHYWLRDYQGFLEFFAAEVFPEPHSTKQIEDMVGWGLETTAETLVLTQLGSQPASREETEAILGRVRCPVLVIHGDDDRLRPLAIGAAVAELTGGALVVVEGGGHCPQARHPVKVNLCIREFVESLGGRVR